ncbi:hypothetical protein PHAMO_380003 [Magnetospirillum molischianum DSM 120]|uniref:Uncharacterized protein n=1 Tax=Magnetospirillum molischianum DSM 120 TaxID=1150626 RepID=H8FVE7_MAGML|nr:hypothetical protein PHAMO_380003 [Magnetospirillum molischianum DSM 120]
MVNMTVGRAEVKRCVVLPVEMDIDRRPNFGRGAAENSIQS